MDGEEGKRFGAVFVEKKAQYEVNFHYFFPQHYFFLKIKK